MLKVNLEERGKIMEKQKILNEITKSEEDLQELSLYEITEENHLLCDTINFPYSFDLNWDIKSLYSLQGNYEYLDIKSLDIIINYLLDNYNIKFKELTKRRISLVKKVVEEYNYIISRG